MIELRQNFVSNVSPTTRRAEMKNATIFFSHQHNIRNCEKENAGKIVQNNYLSRCLPLIKPRLQRMFLVGDCSSTELRCLNVNKNCKICGSSDKNVILYATKSIYVCQNRCQNGLSKWISMNIFEAFIFFPKVGNFNSSTCSHLTFNIEYLY